jgi:dynein heavy chain
MTEFQKLCFVKMIRSDKLIASMQIYISNNIGKEFIDPPAYDPYKSYKESSNIVPIVYILTAGSDPINDIKGLAEKLKMETKFSCVSLGRGQEKKAIQNLDEWRGNGGWVLLQNCHLASSFMNKLEEIV